MANVTFKRGSGALPTTPVEGALYFRTDTGTISMGVSGSYVNFTDIIVLGGTGVPTAGDIKEGKLYLTDNKLCFKSGAEVIAIGDTSDIAELKTAIQTLNGADTVTGSVAKAVKDASDALKGNATTDTKDSLTIEGAKKYAESLINGDPDATDPDDPTVGLKIVKADTPETGFAATYKLMQNGTQLGASINLIKDQFLDTIELTNTDGEGNTGKFIHMTFKDSNKSEIYLNVGDLVDVYTSGSAAGDMIVIAIDDNNKITATITDGTVTKAKLDTDVQSSLDKADTAVQPADLVLSAAEGKYVAGIEINATSKKLALVEKDLPDTVVPWGDFTEAESGT